MSSPNPQFAQNVSANIAYWHQRTATLTEDNLAELVEERQNLYRAVEFGLGLAETWPETVELVLQALPLIDRRGYWQEWIPLLEKARDSCGEGDLHIYGRILDQLGILYRRNQQLAQAISTHEEEVTVGQRLQDKWRLAHAHINLGSVYRLQRRYDAAEKHILLALENFRAISAPIVKFAFVHLNLGLSAQARGQWSPAEDYYRQAISFWRDANNPANLAMSLKLLGQVLRATNRVAEAEEAFQEALAVLNPTPLALDKSKVLSEMGILHFAQKNYAQARRYFLRANSAELRQSGNLFDQAIVLNNLGNVYLALNSLADAATALAQSIELWRQLNDPVQLANSLGTLGEVQAAQGNEAPARQFYQEAIALLADYPDDAWGQSLLEKFQAAETRLVQETA